MEDLVPRRVMPADAMRERYGRMNRLHPWLGRLGGRMGVGSFVPLLNEGLNLMDSQEGEAEGLGRAVTDKLSPYVPAQVAGGAGALAYTAASMFDPVPGPSPAMVFHHGSPHKFTKFSMDKIGTGEGAQAFGHGLYFAESPKVAGTYKADRSHVGRVMAGNPVDLEWGADKIAQEAADIYGDDAVKHLESILRQRKGLRHPDMVSENKKLSDAIDLVKSGKVESRGSLYEVDIPDEAIAKMLDWDAPLSKQPESVQKALKKFKGREQRWQDMDEDRLRKFLSSVDPNGDYVHSPFDELKEIAEEMDINDDGALNDYLNSKVSDWFGDGSTGESVYRWLATMEGGGSNLVSDAGMKEASRILKEAGIPGIKYLDGGSRTAGKGTRNVVVFDDSIIEMLSRNGESLKAGK